MSSSLINAHILDYQSLANTQERLEWLIERTPIQPLLQEHERNQSNQIKECISGLWLSVEKDPAAQTFRVRCFSGSPAINALCSFMCDLLSDSTAEELIKKQETLLESLKLDALLTSNRKHVVKLFLSKVTALVR